MGKTTKNSNKKMKKIIAVKLNEPVPEDAVYLGTLNETYGIGQYTWYLFSVDASYERVVEQE